jgi:hypothetical protein
MRERFQQYQLTVPTVPVGGLTDLAIQLDTDAPFLARSVKSRNLGLSGWNFQDAHRTNQSSGLRTDVIPQPPGGLPSPQPSRGSIVYPQAFYPIGGVIVCSVGNNTNAPLQNVKLTFTGSKLYADGAIPSFDYPSDMSVFPTVYPLTVKGVQPVSLTQQVPLTIDNDADVMLRGAVCDPFTISTDGGPFNGFNYSEVYITLRDQHMKPFSNEPIHINDIFGQGQPAGFQSAGANNDDVLFLPNLFTPEIPVRRRYQIYMDILRNDVGGGPVDLNFRFFGCKVFQR